MIEPFLQTVFRMSLFITVSNLKCLFVCSRKRNDFRGTVFCKRKSLFLGKSVSNGFNLLFRSSNNGKNFTFIFNSCKNWQNHHLLIFLGSKIISTCALSPLKNRYCAKLESGFCHSALFGKENI